MPKLLEIGEGAFQELSALQHFECQHNLHLHSIHKNAFVQPGADAKEHGVWPPIRSVSSEPSLSLYRAITSNNNIFAICRVFFQLLLNNNNLSVIDQALIGRWDAVEKIDIRFNPFRCDCDTQWLVDTLIPQINGTKDSTGLHEIV